MGQSIKRKYTEYLNEEMKKEPYTERKQLLNTSVLLLHS